jgi:hypothetical protein
VSTPTVSDKDQAIAPKGEKTPAKSEPEGQGHSRLSWFVGWILVPATVIGVIFGAGVVLGAHRHDGWFARTVVWLVELF